MSSGLRVAVAGIVALAVALAWPGVANADNSNNNTNTNDVTQIGDPSDMFDRSAENTNWPPAGSDWPPSDITNSRGESGGAGAAPIVMPVGQPASAEAATAGTSPASKPIVPVTTP
jgi:hypothetical protein